MGLAIATAAIQLANSGVSLTKQILSRTSPREVRQLEKLEKAKLALDGMISDYKRLRPSERVQARLELYINDREKVCNEILIMQKYAEQKLQLMLASYKENNSNNTTS